MGWFSSSQKEVEALLGALEEAGQTFRQHGTAFELVKKEVHAEITRRPKLHARVVRESGGHPRIHIYTALAVAAATHVGSGKCHVSRGVLNPFGQKLQALYDAVIDALVECGEEDAESAEEQKRFLQEDIASAG